MKTRKKWVTSQNVEDINLKNRLWKKINKLKKQNKQIEENLKKTYARLKNKIRKDLEENRQNYFKNELSKNKNLWEMINKITNRKKRSTIEDNLKRNFKHEEMKQLSNKFNNNFAKLTTRLKTKYDRKQANEDPEIDVNEDISLGEDIGSATAEEFESIIQNMKTSDAVGVDEVSLKHLKKVQKTQRCC